MFKFRNLNAKLISSGPGASPQGLLYGSGPRIAESARLIPPPGLRLGPPARVGRWEQSVTQARITRGMRRRHSGSGWPVQVSSFKCSEQRPDLVVIVTPDGDSERPGPPASRQALGTSGWESLEDSESERNGLLNLSSLRPARPSGPAGRPLTPSQLEELEPGHGGQPEGKT